MKEFWTILLLLLSNSFMTLAWYGHLKWNKATHAGWKGMILTILLSWFIALFEYMLMIPANRIGFKSFGGPFDLYQLKIIQEVISIFVFIIFALFIFRTQNPSKEHILAFILIIIAAYLVFKK